MFHQRLCDLNAGVLYKRKSTWMDAGRLDRRVNCLRDNISRSWMCGMTFDNYGTARSECGRGITTGR